MKLYSYPGNKNAYKVQIAAEYAKIELEMAPFEMGVTNKSDSFLKLNPNGKVPTLELNDGTGIFESNAIARYIARLSENSLLGDSPFAFGQIEQWIDFATTELDAPLLSWFLPLKGVWPYDKKKEQGAKEAVTKALKVLDAHLNMKTYLVGDKVTLADIVMVCNLLYGFTTLFDPKMRDSFPNVVRYFTTCVAQPNFEHVVGEISLCEAVPKPPAQKK